MDETKEKTKQSRIAENIIACLLAIGAILCVYTPNYLVFKYWAGYSAQITIVYWLFGFAFLVVKRPYLTMASFICCAFLCLYLKSTTNPALEPVRKTSEPIIKVAHFNASSNTESSILNAVRTCGADIISVQEVTPGWNKLLKDSVSDKYRFQCDIVTLDVYSLKILSRFPFASCDTFYCGNVPNLVVGLKNQATKNNLYIIGTYIAPPVFSSAYLQLQRQLDSVASHIQRANGPVITVGDYNIHSSSYEIQQFRRSANLNDSRRGYRPDLNNGYISLLDVPTDHIFYTNQLNCVEFQTISGVNSERLGIIGSYQFNKDSLVLVGH